MKENIAYVRMALHNAKGNELERVQILFGNMSDESANKIYPGTIKTYREILNDCRQDRNKHEAAVKWFESVIDSLESEK